jgi:hypothetical protein
MDGIIIALALASGTAIISFKLTYPLLNPKYRPHSSMIPWMTGMDSG